MIDEQQRRAWLGAMQIDVWLPRQALPFAAPSRPELLALPEPRSEAPARRPVRPRPGLPAAESVAAPAAPPARKVLPLPARPSVGPAPEPSRAPAPAPAAAREAPPRFALQLLRAGACLLLVELPSGEPFASRDPAYRLLKDLLRAAQLPDSPQPLGEPIRWPMLRGNPVSFDQGPEAARLYVRTVLQGQLEQAPAPCLWLVGEAAARFAASRDAQASEPDDLGLGALGQAWRLPGLEHLMTTPALKAALWDSMRRTMRCWTDKP